MHELHANNFTRYAVEFTQLPSFKTAILSHKCGQMNENQQAKNTKDNGIQTSLCPITQQYHHLRI